MTYPLLKIVDDDLQVLFDLNDITGANNPYNFETILDPSRFDLGIATPVSGLFKPFGNARASVIGRDLGVAEMSFVIWCRSDDYRSGIRELQYLLSAGGTLLWQPSASEAASIIEFLGANQLPNAYVSAAGVRPVVVDGEDRGLEIGLVRQGLIRNATEVSSATNLLTNATLLVDSVASGRPDDWEWLSSTNITSESIDNDFQAYDFNIATTSARSLQQQSQASSFAPGDIATFSFYVRAPVASIVRARAAVQFYQADGTTTVGTEHVGTLTDIGNGWTRVSVTTTAAGALTSRATVSVRFENSAATDTAVKVNRAQLEIGSTPSSFVIGEQVITNNLDTAPVAVDDFNRTTSNAWGTADLGGAWSLTGTAADFDTVTTVGGRATIVATAANQTHSASLPVSVADVEVSMVVQTDKLAVGGNQEVFVSARGSGTTFYRAVAELRTSGDIFLRIDKVIAGVSTTIASAVDTTINLAANVAILLRFEVTGSRLRARLVGTLPESSAWTLEITDTSITTPGFVGVGTILLTGASNAPVTWSITDFVAHALERGCQAFVYVDGSAPTEVSLDFEIDGGPIQALNVASRQGPKGRRIIQLDGLQEVAFGGSGGIERFVDKEASNGAAYQIDTGGGATLQPVRFARLEITDDLESLKGDHDVYLRVKNDEAANASRFRLGWGPSLADPAPYVGAKVTHDTDPRSGTTPATAYVEIHVGRIHIREDVDLEGVAIELFVSATASGIVWADCLILVPTETSATISLPYSARRAISVTDAVLDASGETDTLSLGILAAGRYRVTWYYSAEVTNTELFRFKIQTAASVNVILSEDSFEGDRIQQGFALEFDADGVTSYKIVAAYDSFAGSPIYTIHERWLEQLQYASDTEHILTDPENYLIEKRDDSGHVLIEAGLSAGSTPLVLEPGLHSLYVAMLRPRHLGFYRELKPVLSDSVNLNYSYSVKHRQ